MGEWCLEALRNMSGLTKWFKGGKHKVPFSHLGVKSLKAKEVSSALLLR